MGCGNPKVKVEDELMKTKLERIQVQMERMNQLKLLQEMTGQTIQTPKIPDYIAEDTIKNPIKKDNNSTSFSSTKKVKILSRPKRSRSQFIRRRKLKRKNDT